MTSERFAHIVSIALVPPTAAAVVVSLLVYNWEHGGLFHLVLVWVTAVLGSGGLQIVYVLYLKRMQEVTAYDVPNREDRRHPYLVSAGISVASMIILLFLNASVFVWALLWCFAANTLILYGINQRWKISAHMMGLTGPVLFLLPLFGWWTILVVPVVVLLGWARIVTRSHDLAQVIAGALAGIVLTLAQIWIILHVLLPLMH